MAQGVGRYIKIPKNRLMNTAEDELIRKIRVLGPKAASRNLGTRLGIGDDAALLRPRRGYDTILTCDWSLEETHFLLHKHPADAVGWKCLARAVSDIAAMGGQPRGFLMSLALPNDLTGHWLTEFLGGLRRASRTLHCPLAGGDTTRQSKVLINITVVGEVRAGRAVLRSGARPGDILYVSGRLGEADLGLQRLRTIKRVAKNDPALKKHLYPEPRIALGRWLSDSRIATAMMDLSDGLSTDLPRLCAASGVGGQLNAANIPTVRASNRNGLKNAELLNLALNGGDDYELLFAVSPGKARRLPSTFQTIPLTAIGEITRDRSLTLLHLDGHETTLRPGGWDPFNKRSA
jgi:thiamine-monophosphate kinase